MEAEAGNGNRQQGLLHRLLPAVLHVLLISIGYVDPGKWVITIEGGARFGLDLVVPMLLFNLAAILCQYLSARIGVVTGRDLAQICCDEYEKSTQIFLGVQAELSVIVLDLTMVLGVAHGINLLFGVDLSTCVFLAALDAILFPVFASLLDHCRASFLCMYAAGFILLSYVFGVLISQPEISLSMTGMPTRLSGESAFALMSLLGASIMPHNFYLHSSIVQQHQRPPNISTNTLCHDHFFAIVCVFSGLFLVNYVLMNAASNVFYDAGLVLVSFQDAMSLLEQAFRNGVLPVIFMLVMFLSNQITASTWNLGGQVVLHDFLGLHIPGWLHRATIRIVASIPALYCVWTSGAEGIYQLLIFTQVMIALLLPSSAIPLFRIASSRPIMGVYKMSSIVEFLALLTFVGMLGLKIVFVVEMIFGNSDWVNSLRSNAGIVMSFPFVVLLVTAGASFSLMLWLAATPLKSATSRNEAQALNWDLDRTESVPVPKAAREREENDSRETRYHEDEPACIEERSSIPENSIESHFDLSSPNYDLDLPETILESDQEILLNTVNDNSSNNICPSPTLHGTQESISVTDSASAVVNEAAGDDLPGSKTLKIEEMNSVERTTTLEGNLQIEKHDDLGDALEPKEPSKPPSGSISSWTLDGPPSFKSLSGKNDDGGSGTGSLSRLAGLGRAARRQLAAILDEFWGQLYDFHGQHTQEAKMKKLDVLLGVGLKQINVDIIGMEPGGYFPSVGGRASDALISSSLYDSPKQLQGKHSIDSSYGYSRGSSMWSNHMQLLDAYGQNSSHNVDSGERRYSSLRTATSAYAWDYQPATVHGYQIKSYLNRIAKDRSSDSSNGQMDLQASSFPALGPTNYRDSVAFALEQKLQNGITPNQDHGFQNVAVSKNSPLQSEISYYDIGSPGINDNSGIYDNSKKYHSLPSISGLSVPCRDLYMSKNSAQWDSSAGYGSSAGRINYETSMYANAGSRAGVPSSFDELSQSKGYGDAFPLQLSSSAGSGSIWSRQPFEQFGVAEIKRTTSSEERGSGLNSTTRDTAFGMDLESKLLLSFRHCIGKLLKLDGSDWLFRQNDGADEDLIDRVAAREKFLYDAETRQINQAVHSGEPQYLSSERRYGSTLKSDEVNLPNVLISSVPNCGEGCIWKVDLIISFGVWCIHRILDLSLMESRPELWGKYTYVLNRLQGVIDLAFSKPRSPMSPCFCLEIPAEYQQKSSSPVSNGMLPPTAKPDRGKCTNATVLLDIIKDVELAISCRKGRSGTAAGDVAFPKGKENLASVLKRYKRRLSNLVSAHDGSGSRKVPMSVPLPASYGS
ncbi:ENHANCED RESPONSE TO ABA3, CYTOKININ RESISTANT 1, ORESARA 2, ETHYLENE INSENSITIVE 2, ORESARA 3 [Hibiscus trionum]|uniref:ENHANCED RESPONSE TO ABA3, CYTOKININ RESISTANT 1, ORESARA 2, ETHYLENE INSENSITIVE 2, ORESARA 3 n=1 Tax=Hibiscus trionum TaxID=183268 RepID=A0A9W7GXQ7_HIBTR|nr:ENHANCED RESPONSE TO ABA3, CYTOKININ RESISTANT 1, ORESARA 2, ETHYLENE INSENSITIVE 2, ORESARA 3 [Hibiscus trionum]